MIDAVEADRASREKAASAAEAGFVCEPAAEQPERKHPPQSADERKP
jgi:hypothetical protein